MRTQEEIVQHYEAQKQNDIFGFKAQVLVPYLDFEHAKPYLKEGAKSEDWKTCSVNPKECLLDYLKFAWEKANNCRGISASRSIKKLCEFAWLDGNDEAVKFMSDDSLYEFYGKPQLVLLSRSYG